MAETSLQMRLAPPFYSEARAYCDRFDITDGETCEKVRLSMVHQEYMRRMEPFTRILADMMAFELPPRMVLDMRGGAIATESAPRSPGFLRMEQEVMEVAARVRKELGIELVGPDRQESQTGLAFRS